MNSYILYAISRNMLSPLSCYSFSAPSMFSSMHYKSIPLSLFRNQRSQYTSIVLCTRNTKMGSSIEAKVSTEVEAEEEARAQVDIWKYIFGYTPMAVLNCAIELQIADVLESHGGSMTLPELSSALGCSQSALYRIMRYLIHRGIFNQNCKSPESSICYIQTALSRLLMKNEVNSMAALVLLESSPVMLAPWHRLCGRVLTNGTSAFEATHGEDVWDYAAEYPEHNKLINDAVACHARLAMSKIIDHYPEMFKGIGSLVDVGGGDGTSPRTLVKACPWIHGINFDIPHVISVAPRGEEIDHVDGDMFESVPKADVAFLMFVLHDWGDDECIQILKKCREAIPKDTGKMIIADAVIGQGGEDDKYTDVRLALDMVMLSHTETGKERTIEEWEYVVNAAGFTRFTVKSIQSVISLIEAYP